MASYTVDLSTMEGQSCRPALLAKLRSKYGRCDYKRFDNIASTHMQAGRGRIGKVDIDCRFMFTKSRWGVIGESKKPGGIIYLDLDFSQPPDCKLESATITVTLTENDGEGDSIPHSSAYPVQFTDHYGPKCIRGEESLVQTRKIKNRTPEVQVLGYGAGGLGINKEKVVQTKGRWDFSGFISPTKGNLWYNQLRWELKENSLEWLPSHSNLFHTAFAVEHNATRFYMTVQVSGKLAKLSDKIKSRLKFGERAGKDEEIVTKIEWRDGYSCVAPLDELAKDLHEAMGYANWRRAPVEVRAAQPASYHEVNPSQAPASTPAPAQHPLPGTQPAQQLLNTESWLASGQPPSVDGGPSTAGHTMQQLPAPTLDELSNASAGFARPPSHPPQPPLLSTTRPGGTQASEASGFSSSATLVNSAVTTQSDGESSDDTVSDTCQKDTQHETDAESQITRDGVWLGITAILLDWFVAKVGIMVFGLAAVLGLSQKTKSGKSKPGKEARSRSKRKTVGFDDASETGRIKTTPTRPVYPVRGRLRARRGQRQYLTVDVGKRKTQGWREDTKHSAGSV